MINNTKQINFISVLITVPGHGHHELSSPVNVTGLFLTQCLDEGFVDTTGLPKRVGSPLSFDRIYV